jgi:hypothetical protein
MTRHFPRSHIQQKQEEQSSKTEKKGWYCLAHHVRYLCDICKDENSKIGEVKYYFISG